MLLIDSAMDRTFAMNSPVAAGGIAMLHIEMIRYEDSFHSSAISKFGRRLPLVSVALSSCQFRNRSLSLSQ